MKVIDNCFNCGYPIYQGEKTAKNRSGRVVDLDCADSDDGQTEAAYREWAEFNGVAAPWHDQAEDLSEVYADYRY